jgi:hypothetical protein
MELESDPYRLAQLSTHHEERHTGIWWVTVIVLGVFIGNLMSFGAYRLYVQWELQQIAIALKIETTEQAEKLKVEMARLAKKNEASRREQQKKSEVNAKLLQTCEFWRQQVIKENTVQNRAYREAACTRAINSAR